MTTLLSFKNKQVLQLFRSSLSFLLCVQFLHFKLLLPYLDFLRNFRLHSHDTTTVRLSFSINDTKFQHIYFPFYINLNMTITWKITLSIDENMLKRTRHAHFQLYILSYDCTAVAFHDSQLKKNTYFI